MEAPRVGTGDLSPALQKVDDSSINWKTLGFALLIIVCIGGLLAMAGVGVGGLGMEQHWWQAKGLLSQLAQAESITLIAAGGGGLLLAGLAAALIFRCMRNQPKGIPIIEHDPLAGWEDPDAGEISNPIVLTPEEKAALLVEKKQARDKLRVEKQTIEYKITQISQRKADVTLLQKSAYEGLDRKTKDLAEQDATAEKMVHHEEKTDHQQLIDLSREYVLLDLQKRGVQNSLDKINDEIEELET